MTWGCGCRFCFICRRTICCFRSSMSELSSGRAAAAFSPQGLVKWKRVSPIPEGYCLTSSVYRSTVLLKINNSPEISRVTGSSCSVSSSVTVVGLCAVNLHPMIDNHQVRFAEFGQVHRYYQWLWMYARGYGKSTISDQYLDLSRKWCKIEP